MTETLPKLSLNRDARIQVWRIGKEKQPVFVVDDAFEGIDELVEFAARSHFVMPEENSYYPGLNAQLPSNYLPTLLPALQRPLVDVFNAAPISQNRCFGFFGLSNLPPADMRIRQALPHTDSANVGSFATVHFLSTAFGGTAFYRHRTTGFEVVSNVRSHEFNTVRSHEIEGPERPPLDALYEEIAYAEPVFNRLILYRATQLHSARMENVDRLSSDPRTGRLTVNTFLNA